MPHSRTRQAIATRRRYTQERCTAASAGATRAGGHGLDDCTARQVELRALLALYLFNTEVVLFGDWPNRVVIRPQRVSTITYYDSIVSPRRDHLVLISHAPDNLVGYLGRAGRCHVPGLRSGSTAPTRRGYRCYDFAHVPTGALLTVTSDPLGPDRVRAGVARREADRIAGCDAVLSDDEQQEASKLPAMTADAKRLLAALTVRTNLVDPARRWYLGAWFNQDRRRLIGQDDHWDLEWFGGYPCADDLVACLTDPVIGIAAATARSLGPSGYQLSLGDARLTIRAWTTHCIHHANNAV